MTIQLDRRFKKNVKGKFGKYEFLVGVLDDAPHLEAKRGERGLKGQDVLKTFAGGPSRKVSRKPSGLNISDVSKELRKNLGFNYLTKPFNDKRKSQADILNFTKAFFNYAFGRTQKKRCENLLQAIVRNPMLRGDYGANSQLTQKIKGFDRKTIDTAQLFKAIKAVCKTRSFFGV